MTVSIISAVCTILTVLIAVGRLIKSSVSSEDLNGVVKNMDRRFDSLEQLMSKVEHQLEAQADKINHLSERVAVLEYKEGIK